MKRKIEKALRAEADRFVPDGRDAIRRRVGYPVVSVRQSARRGGWKRRYVWYAAPVTAILVLAIVLTLVFATSPQAPGGGGGGDLPQTTFSNSVVRVDINPSVKFLVGESGAVARQDALNKDGAILLMRRDFVGAPIETATEAVVDLASKLGYLSEGKTVRLKVLNDDAEVESELIGRLNVRIEGKLDALNAKEVGVVSEGKNEIAAYLVRELGFTPDAAEQMTADELEDVLEDHLDGENESLGAFEQQIAGGIGQFLKKCSETAESVVKILRRAERENGAYRLGAADAAAVADFVRIYTLKTDLKRFDLIDEAAYEELLEQVEEDAEETREAIAELLIDPDELSDVLEDFYDRYKIYLKNDRKNA